jgi:hypothetical protein
MNPNAKTIPVKGYLSPDTYLALKAVFDPVGLSMSSAIGIGLRQLSSSMGQLDTAHRTRRKGRSHMPKTGLRLPMRAPCSRPGRGGAPKPPMRV